MESGSSIEEVFDEVSKIRKLLEILLRENIKDELERVATSPERKKIWSLCDGTLDTKSLAEEVGVSLRTVQKFVKDLKDQDLIKHEKGGFPQRIFDYVPYDWDI